jgi:hypothetical protein
MAIIKLRIPCKEQFAFIEEDYDGDDIKGRYDELYGLMNSNNKVSDRQFIKDMIDIMRADMLFSGEGAIEYHDSLDELQKLFAKEAKNMRERAINKYKPTK